MDFVIDVHDLKKSFGTRKVVDGLTLQVGRGEICGFLGANGSGKTTTIRMLCGLLVPDGGSGTCLGRDIIHEASLIRREAGYMTQKFSFYEGSCCWTSQRPELMLRRAASSGILSTTWPGEGLTVLVSTHYMDEAERCIVYLADGRIVVQGAAAEVSSRSGLVIFEVTGGDLDAAARRLRRTPGVEAAAAALRNTGYYKISILASEADAERGLARGELLFVINIPPNFDRSIDRGESPSVLVDADATDPTAIANATASLPALAAILDRDLPPVRQTETSAPPFQFVVHARYNPEQLTVLNIDHA